MKIPRLGLSDIVWPGRTIYEQASRPQPTEARDLVKAPGNWSLAVKDDKAAPCSGEKLDNVQRMTMIQNEIEISRSGCDVRKHLAQKEWQ